MPVGIWGYIPFSSCEEIAGPLRGKGRGVTKSPKRAKRRNRRRP